MTRPRSVPIATTRVCGRIVGARARAPAASAWASPDGSSQPSVGSQTAPRTPSVDISGKRSCASSAVIRSSGSPKVFAQPAWRRNSSNRSGVEARRSEPTSCHDGSIAGLGGESPVQLGPVHHHPGERDRAPQLADEPGRVEGRPGGQLGPVDEDDVRPAQLGQVIGDRGAADTAADDDGPGVLDHPGEPPAPGTGTTTRSVRGRLAPRRAHDSRDDAADADARRSSRSSPRSRPGPDARSPPSGSTAGLTNANYRVEVDGDADVRPDPGRLDRAARRRPGERAAQHPRGRRGRRLAARRPRAARVGRLRARVGRRRRTMSNEALRGAGDAGAHRRGRCGSSTPARGSATTSTCSGSPSATCALVDERDIAVPAGYREHLDRIPGHRGGPRRPSAADASRATTTCSPRTTSTTGERLWIVDYEYSGNDDPTFELGNTAQELGYDEHQLARALRGVLRRGVPGPARRGCTSR